MHENLSYDTLIPYQCYPNQSKTYPTQRQTMELVMKQTQIKI